MVRRYRPYIKNTVIRNCPSNPKKVDENSTWVTGGAAAGSNYGINVSISGWQNALKQAALVSPARLVLATDAAELDQTKMALPANKLTPKTWKNCIAYSTDWQVTGPFTFGVGWPPDYSYTATAEQNSLRRPVGLHSDGTNVGFADGHAKWYNIDTLLGPLATTGGKGYDKTDPMNLWANN